MREFSMSARLLLKRLRSSVLLHSFKLGSKWPCGIIRLMSLSVGRNILKLHDRGIFQSVFPEENVSTFPHFVVRTARLLKELESSPQCIYCGFDPTADSLHVGNLLAIIALLHCQRSGHKPIVVLGGATALIGDPSGRSTQRQPITALQVEENIISIADSLNRIITNHQQFLWKASPDNFHPIKVLNNADWYKDKPVLEFLLETGHHFRMGSMLSRHSVSSRLQSAEGMSFTEFTYQVFQSYDWYHLLKSHDCTIQIGGVDQMGNINSGHDFISRQTKAKVFGLTVPLITSASGSKLGKSEGNAIWLNPDKTSPFQLYQHFLNLSDSEVHKYLNLYTFLSDKEIEDVMRKQQRAPEKRPAQRTVAEQITLLVHGEQGLEVARRWTDALFGGTAEALAKLSPSELCKLFENAPTTRLPFQHGVTVLEICMTAKCFEREVDAERVIKAGGVSINYRRVDQPDYVLIPGEHILSNDISLIRLGKKRYFIIQWL